MDAGWWIQVFVVDAGWCRPKLRTLGTNWHRKISDKEREEWWGPWGLKAADSYSSLFVRPVQLCFWMVAAWICPIRPRNGFAHCRGLGLQVAISKLNKGRSPRLKCEDPVRFARFSCSFHGSLIVFHLFFYNFLLRSTTMITRRHAEKCLMLSWEVFAFLFEKPRKDHRIIHHFGKLHLEIKQSKQSEPPPPPLSHNRLGPAQSFPGIFATQVEKERHSIRSFGGSKFSAKFETSGNFRGTFHDTSKWSQKISRFPCKFTCFQMKKFISEMKVYKKRQQFWWKNTPSQLWARVISWGCGDEVYVLLGFQEVSNQPPGSEKIIENLEVRFLRSFFSALHIKFYCEHEGTWYAIV